ncbi:MAG: beta-ketoacyl-[acyl-carrier-protein] synthase II, partial [Burkholderiales bacterium]|nr:beta-ketoacyl-[acyl-carrier-protein] synthase II [Burkholderiales bacterium]
MAVVAQGLVCAAGRGIEAYAAALRDNRSALVPNDWSRVALACAIGRVAGIEDEPLPPAWSDWDCRATRLAWAALQTDGFAAAVAAARARWGAARVGLVLGTSASTIAASERAYREPAPDGGFPADARFEPLHTLHGVTDFVARALALEGPSATVSAACASSAKAYAQAERWLRLGLADAVVVGGVDALSESLLFGFHALQLVDAGPCRPCDARRAGISVGEAAGFALLQRGAGPWMLLGHGEANDAHHLSAPHPQGLGAELALDAALARAGIDAAAIDYLALHATATPRNDAVEAALVARRYGPEVHASATKG